MNEPIPPTVPDGPDAESRDTDPDKAPDPAVVTTTVPTAAGQPVAGAVRTIDLPVTGLDEDPAAPVEHGTNPAPSPWDSPAPPGETVCFSFNMAKLEGQGEDADPVLHVARTVAVAAVLDGMGGAGGTVYQTPDGPRTGAYLASRVARDVVEIRMLELLGENAFHAREAADDLARRMTDALNARLVELQAPRSGLRSRLLRALPTTVAIAALKREAAAEPRWACHLMWAGDSRIYSLSPDGITQLTADDIKDRGDAMANLRQDSVISNAASADTPFQIHDHQTLLTSPFILIAATDGCFGYLSSPMHFESLLLCTLRDSADTESWSRALQAQIADIAGDDAAMAVVGVGADHSGFQRMFADRTSQLAGWLSPIDELNAEVGNLQQQLGTLRQQHFDETASLWATYKGDYERHLPEPTSEGTSHESR